MHIYYLYFLEFAPINKSDIKIYINEYITTYKHILSLAYGYIYVKLYL